MHDDLIDLEVDFSPPEGVTLPLWRSLARNLRDRIAPEKLPPLKLTSRPVSLGLLLGDYLDLPWYRTVFTNLGDVISPETRPPLQLESRPVDVGELIGDQISRPWWTSLLRNLADRVAPERLPPLELTSAPANPVVPSQALLLTCWSNVIATPKVFLPDSATPVLTPASPGLVLPAMPAPAPDPAQMEFVHILESDLRRDLHHSRLRERLLIAVFAIEVILLVGGHFWPR
ncbi:MAG TPA: hypothetical protein VEI01_15595 [Terriglobales bacterium]|nr:hypothetical protein [Terriglobales bacterium]